MKKDLLTETEGTKNSQNTTEAEPVQITLSEQGEESAPLKQFEEAFNRFATGGGKVRVSSLDVFKVKKPEGGS